MHIFLVEKSWQDPGYAHKNHICLPAMEAKIRIISPGNFCSPSSCTAQAILCSFKVIRKKRGGKTELLALSLTLSRNTADPVFSCT